MKKSIICYVKKAIIGTAMIMAIAMSIVLPTMAETLIDGSNVIPDVFPIGNLTITSGYSIPNDGRLMVAYIGANYAGETNDGAGDSGNISRIQTNSTSNPGEYITITDVGSQELNKYGNTVTFTISNMLWNKTFDYLPEIYIPDTLDELTALWYSNEPIAFVTFRVTSVSTGVTIERTNVRLQDVKRRIGTDRYYKMSEVFRDSALGEGSIDALYNNDLIINNLSIAFFKYTDSRFDTSSVRVKYKTFKPDLDSNGVKHYPLVDYYNYFLRNTDTSSYDKGYEDGYDKGKFEGDREGFKRGYNVGKQAGYQEGYDKGATEGYDFTSWVGNTLSSVMNVQIGFISLGSVVGIVVAILLIKWIIKIVGG